MTINEIREGDLVKVLLLKNKTDIVPVVERTCPDADTIQLTFLHKGKKRRFKYAPYLDLSLTNCVGVYRSQIVTVYERELEEK